MINYITRNEYTGKNVSALYASKIENDYTSDEWITYRQAQTIGLSVIRGEHGTPLQRVTRVKNRDAKKGDKFKTTVRKFTVFNIEQTEATVEAV